MIIDGDYSNYDRVVSLYQKGLNPSDIVKDTGIPKNKVFRYLRAAERRGEIKRGPDGHFVGGTCSKESENCPYNRACLSLFSTNCLGCPFFERPVRRV